MGKVRDWLKSGIEHIRSFAYAGPNAGRKEPPPRPRVGVALGGGFARGIAHLGVLKVFEQENIPVDCIAGTSVGALIAAAYASGASVEAISRRACNTGFRDFARWNLSRFGLAINDRLDRYLYEFCGKRNIEDLKIPLAIATTDLCSGESVYFTRGEIGTPLRASCAYPGLFQPVEYEGRLLVDGFLAAPVPLSGVRALGAEVTVAVYLGAGTVTARPRHMGEVLWRSFAIMQHHALRSSDLRSDIVVEPDVSRFSWDDFRKTAELMAAGEAAARMALPKLRALLSPEEQPAAAKGPAQEKLKLVSRPTALP